MAYASPKPVSLSQTCAPSPQGPFPGLLISPATLWGEGPFRGLFPQTPACPLQAPWSDPELSPAPSTGVSLVMRVFIFLS